MPELAGTASEKLPSAVVVPVATAKPTGWPKVSMSNNSSVAPETGPFVTAPEIVVELPDAGGKAPTGEAAAGATDSLPPLLLPPPQAVTMMTQAAAIAVFHKAVIFLVLFTVIMSNFSLNFLLEVTWRY